MKKIKKAIMLIFMLSIFFTVQVNAKENIYFINSNGIEMTKVEYDNIKKIHGEDFLNSMDLETFNTYYEFYKTPNLEIKEYKNNNNLIEPFSATHNTEYKELSITSTEKVNNEKMITVKLNWKKAPKVRSYDVFGFYAPNMNYSYPITKINYYGSYNQITSNIKKTSNGYGISLKLPTDSNNISAQIVFSTSSSGRIYASYQHSVQSISLNDSMNYSFSTDGLGKVFLFNNSSLFDKMLGIDI